MLLRTITPQIDLQVQCNPYHFPTVFLGKNGQADSNIHMEMQGTLHSQNILDKEEQSWKIHTSQLTYYNATVIKLG